MEMSNAKSLCAGRSKEQPLDTAMTARAFSKATSLI